MCEIQQSVATKMVQMDRLFLILLAVFMYVHGVPKLVIGAIIASVLALEYMFYEEHYRVNAHYAYPPGEAREQ